jgi:pimeloyl-ACP methyl ester carboxylesterase
VFLIKNMMYRHSRPTTPNRLGLLPDGKRLLRGKIARIGVLLVALVLMAGCSTNKVTLRPTPENPLVDELQLTSYYGPRPSDRTEQLLRVHNLAYEPRMDPRPLIKRLQEFNNVEPDADRAYAMSELAYLGGMEAQRIDKQIALDLYGASVLYAYEYLFDDRYTSTRNPYDPQYRKVCDLYNSALEASLRIVCANKELKPGTTKSISTASGDWDITCTLRGTQWRPDDFQRIEFVSDYDVNGLKNHYLMHGLGVPLIAVRRSYKDEPVGAKYYPPGLSFPVTALLRPQNDGNLPAAQNLSHKQCVLELYDPLTTTETVVNRRLVPLEGDLTTPLAYFLSRPELDSLATAGLLRPETLLELSKSRPRQIMGLYMVQPYEPGKIPVVLVHGLWSSPMTWMEMFNDLRSSPEIRDQYQFWFYLYPTSQPFWLSAMNLRHDLAEVRKELDPNRQEPALDQMVLVGHSMGGLVSELQTLPSGDDFWRLVSKEPLDQVKADPAVRDKLAQTFYFQPNPSIRRVITIATPHHGSTFSNQTTQWLLEKLINLPTDLINSQQKLFLDNPGVFVDGSLVKVNRSIDSLSPGSPVFPVMLAAHRPPWVKYHNIIGEVPSQWWLSAIAKQSDGVVTKESAHVEGEVSEIVVPADHSTVHAHPLAVLEVRRILLEHLAELRGQTPPRVAVRLPR